MSVLLFKPKANPKKYGPAATFTRASVAYDSSLKQVASGLPRIGIDGVMVEEATTNLLPAGAENFVTGWAAYGGEGITVTDYPTNIPGIGEVIAKRITGNGAGTNAAKYMSALIYGLTSGRTTATTVYALSLNSATVTKIGDQYGNSVSYTTVPTITIQRLASVQSYASVNSQFRISVALATDILDIVVYAPQIENKPYATSYTPPGTTRAAESLSIPVNATQKNLLTLNQATGGDTFGNTTGFMAVNDATVTRDTTEAWNGTGSIKVVTPGSIWREGVEVAAPLTAGKIYTFSVYCHGSGTVNLLANTIGFSAPFVLSGTKQRLSYTFTPTITQVYGIRVITDTQQFATFYIDGLQLEEGTTASDFTIPAVDYSNALIDPAQPFSIEFDATPWVDDKSGDRYLFEFVSGSSVFAVYTNVTSGYYRFYHINGGSTRSILSSVAVVAGVKKTHKISVSGGTITYVIDGATINTTIFDGMTSLLNTSMFIGSRAAGSAHRNASISNVRIRKGVALTAAELAYTGTLRKDSHTTFLRQFKGAF